MSLPLDCFYPMIRGYKRNKTNPNNTYHISLKVTLKFLRISPQCSPRDNAHRFGRRTSFLLCFSSFIFFYFLTLSFYRWPHVVKFSRWFLDLLDNADENVQEDKEKEKEEEEKRNWRREEGGGEERVFLYGQKKREREVVTLTSMKINKEKMSRDYVRICSSSSLSL